MRIKLLSVAAVITALVSIFLTLTAEHQRSSITVAVVSVTLAILSLHERD